MDKLNNYALEDIGDIDSENATDDFDEAVEQAMRDDEINALLESAFADLDDVEPATEGASEPLVSVDILVSKGMKKSDAEKSMKILIKELIKIDALKKDITPNKQDIVKKGVAVARVDNISPAAALMVIPPFAAAMITSVMIRNHEIRTAIKNFVRTVDSTTKPEDFASLFKTRITTESVSLEDDDDFEDDELDSATESSMFLDIIMDSCDSMEEFQDLVNESAYEWEMYGLIDDAKSALEATKIMKVENWKEKNRKRLINRECIRVAMKKDDPLYKKYKKFRDAMREFREKIFTKYEAIATRNVRQAQQNSKHKAANMHTAGGRDVSARINKAMAKSESGHNPTNAPKKSNAS